MLGLSQDRLSVPSGLMPGFDPSHIAAKNPAMSCISLGNTFHNILGKSPATIKIGAPTSVIHNTIGVATSLSAGNPGVADQVAITSGPNISLISGTQAITLALIGVYNDATAFRSCLQAGDGITHGGTVLLQTGSGTFRLTIPGGATNLATGIPVVAGEPFFVATSISLSGTAFIKKNLKTGAVSTATGSTNSVGDITDGVFLLGEAGSQSGMSGFIAAAMCSNNSLSLSALLEWSDDPWSFWYPSQGILLPDDLSVGVAALIAAARAANLMMMGVG